MLDDIGKLPTPRTIDYPISVNKITYGDRDTLADYYGGKCGDMVAVAPCGDRFENKTYLGILLGEIALSLSCSFNEKKGELNVRNSMYNPAMFVPDLNEVIYGCGSWWRVIKSADHLKKITDKDIENVWYVKALKQFEAKPEH